VPVVAGAVDVESEEDVAWSSPFRVTNPECDDLLAAAELCRWIFLNFSIISYRDGNVGSSSLLPYSS
jgi:hypothetical protein